MSHSKSFRRRAALVVLTAFLVIPSFGCAGLLTTLLWLKDGRTHPAEFSDLEWSKVAVICVRDDSSFGPDRIAETIARRVERQFEKNIRGVEIIHQDEVVDWMDNHSWDRIDYRDIGRGLEAEMVVGIDISDFRTQEGSSLYRGRADVNITVYDMEQDGSIAYETDMPNATFPKTAGIPSTERSADQFRKSFVNALADGIARKFYDYDIDAVFATEASIGEL